MRKFFLNLLAIVAILVAGISPSEVYSQQTLTQINGWNAYVHLPTGYSNSTNTYPTIIFFPGIGEIGFNANVVIANGPGAYLSQGWNGNVVVDGTTVEFIIISLQPSAAFPVESVINQKIQTIKSLYRVDPNKLYLTGLSHGGWCASTFVTGDAYGGPYTYASQVAAVVTVEGMRPDDNIPYPNLFDNFALAGGKYLGFEQINDGRDTRTVVDRMNFTVPNSGVYVQTTFGNGGHCCWNEFYGGQGVQPGIFTLSGTAQNLYQWLARQTLANNNNIPPVANAGPDLSITLPVNTAILNGVGTDADGTITSFLWSQVAGPSSASLLNGNTAIATVNNLIQGQYKFTLKVTDNATASSMDTVIVTVNPEPSTQTCNTNVPVTYYLNNTQPGEIYRPNGSLWKGGDTVKITGTNYSVIEFYNISGDVCRPIVIMPMTTLTTPTFRIKGNSRYLKIWGGPTAYGIKVAGGSFAIASSHHIEADNIEVYGGSIGVYCKQDVLYADTMTWHPNYRMSKMAFKHMWIHDINGEGMYIGITLPDGMTVQSTYSGLDTVIVPVRLDSVEVSNCLVERTTWDGIQLSNARNGNKIFGNTVRDYGTLNIGSQQAGIILGGNCNGDIFGNSVKRGTGNGIEVFGFGTINIYNNFLDSCGYDGHTNSNGTEGQQTIYASDYTVTTDNNPAQRVNVYDNSIYHPKSSGGVFITNYFNNSFPSVVNNNGFCIANPPANWQSTYIKANVPGSTVTNNFLSCSSVNIAPVANAGTDMTITLPVSSAMMVGEGTDADGTIVSYAWQKISGPATGGVLLAPNSAVTVAINMEQGIYRFQLVVTDNTGAIGRDTITVTVMGPVNQAPSANAGPDVSITLPVNTATLSGTGTDTDGTIVAYNWNLYEGPPGSVITGSNLPAATISNLIAGLYKLEFTVTDNSGATEKDTMYISVNVPANQPPVANAGSNISITLPVNSAVLSGAGTDADGLIISYAWIKIAGPAAGILTNASNAIANASGLVQGLYSYELTVTDNNGATGKDTMEVLVNVAGNIAPSANAGADITITLPVNSTTLSGSGIDTDGTIISYSWLKIAGPSAGAITNANNAATTVTSLVQGVYLYQLTVTDNDGAIARDTVHVTVNPAPNQPPVANAGLDMNITLPTNSITLSGSGIDTDGTIVSYSWFKIAGPSAGTISNANIAVTPVTGLVEGIYRFAVTVTDDDGATARDTVQVTVNPAVNLPPVANAGQDINIMLPSNSVTLSGSGTDADGTIISYSWLKIAGPSAGTITNANIAVTTLSGLVQGIYRFQLTVTDDDGAIAKDTLQVSVNPAVNQPPVANAGPDKLLTLPTSNTILSGSATDADGTIVSYAWLKIAGPAPGTLTNANTSTALLTNLVQGAYSYELTATDNQGATGKDTVVVTVNAAPNQLPVANAGSDLTITLPLNAVTLAGSGTDPDGIIVLYTWFKISGPSAGIISNAATAVTSATGLTQGIYLFQLSVTDNAGAITKDTMQVTVNAANNQTPTANAGIDINLTLPANSATLNGSGVDVDGTISSYHWVKVSGPATGNIISPNNATTQISNLVAGSYIFRLTVTDNSGAVATDLVTVNVNAANEAPTALAGNDIAIYLPQDSVQLVGSGTDPNGQVVAYGWRVITAAGLYHFSNSSAAQTMLSNLEQGSYSVELSVTDNHGAKGYDTILVTVGSQRQTQGSEFVNIYPNPVNNMLNVMIESPKSDVAVTIALFDSRGAKLLEKEVIINGYSKLEKINVSKLKPGTYLLQVIYSNDQQVIKKIIKI